MDGASWSIAGNGSSTAMNLIALLPDLPLALLVVAPVLFWGIWMISEESFDELNSLNRERFAAQLPQIKHLSKSHQLMGQTSMEESARNFRKMFLPIFFTAIVIGFVLALYVILQKTEALIPIAIFAGLIIVFILHSKGSSKRSLLEQSKNLEAELPTQIQLLTILVSAGISPAQAIAILSRRSNSISSKALKNVFLDIESGASIVEALDNLKDRFASNTLRRFTTSLILGIERGSSLAPILIAQVRDSRIVSKSEIMRKAGKAEIGLMIPVVFLILPISIIFALFPSYQQLGSFI